MSVECNPPVPLPNQTFGRKLSVILSWGVIIGSVAYLAWTANHPVDEGNPQAGEITDGGIPFSEATELTMLKIQSRLIIAMSIGNTAAVAPAIEQLKEMATTPRSRASIAIVQAFIYPEQGAGLLDQSIARDAPELEKIVSAALENGVTPNQRADLKKQVGWFSELVRPAEASEVAAHQAGIKAGGLKTMMIFGGFGTLAILAFIVGGVLLILFFIKWSNGQLPMKYVPAVASEKRHLFFEAFAVYIGVMALGQWLDGLVPSIISRSAYVVSFLLAVLWPTIRGCSWKENCQLIGWTRGKGFFREVGAGFLGYLGLIVIAALGLLLTLLLMGIVNLIQPEAAPGGAGEVSHPIVGMLGGSRDIWAVLSILFLASVLAPFFEETMFRGALYRYFRNGWGFFLSAVVGGIAFAIIHPQGIFALPALAAMGFGFALLRDWRDSLIASMTAHALNNGVIVCLLVLILR